MATPVTYDPLLDMIPAFPGLIADAMFTDTVTVPCGVSPQPFGTAVGTVSATGVSVLPVVNPEGIAVHDHTIAGRAAGIAGYSQFDAMSVMKRGRIWARASGACTKDGVANYTAATGLFSTAGAVAFPNARFLSSAITIPAIVSGGPTFQVVLVELHNPSL